MREKRFIEGAYVEEVQLPYVGDEGESTLPTAPEDEPELENLADEDLREELVYTPDDEEDLVDPILTYGGFKFLGNSSNEENLNREELGDFMEDLLYDEFIHMDDDEERDILDVVEMGDGGLDIINCPDKSYEEKQELGIGLDMLEFDLKNFIKFDELEQPRTDGGD